MQYKRVSNLLTIHQSNVHQQYKVLHNYQIYDQYIS